MPAEIEPATRQSLVHTEDRRYTPNRFIVNEEDIVKIELARRVTVESIKHLSKNTNLIQDYNKETGDVRPSKILNINKEESFDTYENRFIYSLIKNMKFYIDRKKRNLVEESYSKDDKKFNNFKIFEGNPLILKEPGEYEVRDIFIRGLADFYSDFSNTIFEIKAEGINLLNLGVFKNSKLIFFF